MATGAKLGCTTTLAKGATAIAELTGISGFGASVAQVDVSNMDSAGAKEFIAGLKEGAEFSITGNWTNVASQIALLTDLQAGTSAAYTVTWPSGLGHDGFTAIVTKFDITADSAAAVKFTASLKISGAITHTA
jgi:predicted secreted protein